MIKTSSVHLSLADFLSFLDEEFGYDFSLYSKKSLARRTELALQQFHLGTLSELRNKLLEDRTLIWQLLRYLTINTTELFRDAEYFKFFRERVVPILKTFPYPNIWVAGCSTGEEILSLSIILKEEGLEERSKIYGTDLNPLNLQMAKSRIVRLETIKKASLGYQLSGGKLSLSDYYQTFDESVLFHEELLSNVTLAEHSLVSDGSFSEFHFISCRNVMIYFEPELQIKVLDLFNNSLSATGILGIGSAEDLRTSPQQTLFDLWDQTGFYKKSFIARGGAIHGA